MSETEDKKPETESYNIRTITRIIDGDTFDCILDLGFDVLLEARVRMMGIDTPESRTRDLEEKKYGLLAKEWLKEKIGHAEDVTVRTQVDNEKGKFGRILGQVWVGDQNINKQMIEEGYAVAYWGQSKDDVQDEHMKNRQMLQEKGIV